MSCRRGQRDGRASLGDEGVVLDGVVVEAREVGLLDVPAVAVLAAGDEVVAVVELVVGVAEDGRVAGQGLPAVVAEAPNIQQQQQQQRQRSIAPQAPFIPLSTREALQSVD
jgi:hypothetical protein